MHHSFQVRKTRFSLWGVLSLRLFRMTAQTSGDPIKVTTNNTRVMVISARVNSHRQVLPKLMASNEHDTRNKRTVGQRLREN